MTLATLTPVSNPVTGPVQAFMLTMIPANEKTIDIPERYLLDLWEGYVKPQFQPDVASTTLDKNFIIPLANMQNGGFNKSYQHRLLSLFTDLENFLFDHKSWSPADIMFSNTAWTKLWNTDLGNAYGAASEKAELTYRQHLGNSEHIINGLKPRVFEPYYYACQLITETDVIRAEENSWAPKLSPAVAKYHADLFTLMRHMLLLDMPI